MLTENLDLWQIHFFLKSSVCLSCMHVCICVIVFAYVCTTRVRTYIVLRTHEHNENTRIFCANVNSLVKGPTPFQTYSLQFCFLTSVENEDRVCVRDHRRIV